MGTALKTLTLRLRGSKTELEEMGEDISDMASTTSQLQAKLLALTGGKVDIMLNETEFKNSTQIIREMAEAWEDMNDIQRASALELMGGKRQANVLSALIQNFDTVEKVIETSANSAGSALAENERYLDSIQGKIDQFTNAVQTMWNNAISSDVVKAIIDIGTALIKVVDTIGLIPSVLASIGIAAFIKNILLATTHTNTFTDAIISLLPKLKALALGTEYANLSFISFFKVFGANAKRAIVSLVKMTQAGYAIGGVKGAIAGVTAGLKGLWAAIPVVGQIMIVLTAITAVIKIADHFHKTTKELREELAESQSELSGVKQELESINSELKTTQDRMAELLAMESLSFTEKEELENLRKQNDELQREIDLLELKNKQKNKETAAKFVKTMKKDVDSSTEYMSTPHTDYMKQEWWTVLLFGNDVGKEFASEREVIETSLDTYADYAEQIKDLNKQIYDAGGEDTKNGKNLVKEKKSLESDMSRIETYINGKISEWNENIGDLDYFTGDNLTDEQKATNAWIDYIKNTEDRWAISSGGENAQVNTIKRIFNKEEFEEASKQIDVLVEKLKRDPGNSGIEGEIRRIIETTPKLKENLKEAGSSVDAAYKYFTMSSSSPIDKKVDELSEASRKFTSLLNGGLFNVDGVDTGLVGLFDEEGKIIQTKLSQIFTDTDEKTRQEITSVLEGAYDSIKDGLDDSEIENLTSKLGFKFSRQIMEVQKAALSTENIELFPGLKDEISGIIDTFDELIKSVGDVADAMDTLDQAREEEANSGSMSLETLSKLMESTENYADLIEVDETGAIKLATNAQEILVQQKLDAIKKNAELALADAELALEEAIHAEQTYTQTGPAQDFLRDMTMEVGGAVAFVTSLWNDLTSGNFDGAWERAKSARDSSLEGSQSKYAAEAASASVAVEDAKKRVENAEKMNKIAQGLTQDNVQAMSSSAEAAKAISDKLDEITKKFDGVIDNLDNKQTHIENEIEIKEANGEAVSKSYYEEMISLEQQKQNENIAKRAKILSDIENGTLKMTDEVAAELWETEHAIQESTLRMVEFRQSIVDLYVDAFDKLSEAFGNTDDFFSDQQNYIDKYQELMELQGKPITAGSIQAQIDIAKDQLHNSESTVIALRRELALGLSSGNIKVGSEEWVKMQDEIRAAEAAVLDNKIALEQYNKELKQLSVDAFELVRNAFSSKDQYLTNQQDYMQGYADLLEAQGIDVPAQLYEELIAVEKKKRDNNLANLADARQGFADIEAAGYTAADEEWQDAYQQVVDLEKAVQDNDIAMAEWAKTIRDLDFEKFDRFIGRLDDIHSEIDNLRGLFEDDDVANKDGTWTEEGITSLGLAVQQTELAQQKSKEYGKEIDELTASYNKGEMSEQEYYERLQELKDGQWDAIDAYESAKDAIVDMEEARIDMIEEGLNEEIDAYSELIELKQKELDAERDLYDFKKKVKNQQRDLASLDRRIASLSGSTADADIAELRKLQAERRELQEGLDDEYYQHSKDAQSKALDDELENFQKIRNDYVESLRDTLDDTTAIITEKIAEVMGNADVVMNTMNTTSDEYGVTLSNNLTSPWISAATKATDFKNSADADVRSLINESGIITLFGSDETKAKVTVVFGAGTAAVNEFKQAVDTKIGEVKNVVYNSTSDLTGNLGFPWKETTKEDGPIATFSKTAGDAISGAVTTAQTKANDMKTNLTSPWDTSAINTWSQEVESALKKAQQDAVKYGFSVNKPADVETPDYTGSDNPASNGSKDVGNRGNNNVCDMPKNDVKNLQSVLNNIYQMKLVVDGSYGSATKQAVKSVQKKHGIYASGLYDSTTRNAMLTYIRTKWQSGNGNSSAIGQAIQQQINKLPTSYYAKGTLGTSQDEWAITDESWIGEEITLAAGKNGQLQYLKKGSAVMPSDISANLVEWGKLNPSMMSLSNTAQGINLMSNYISKPELNLSFESLVKADSITQETLPAVKKLVTEELDKFTRKLNYAIKRA